MSGLSLGTCMSNLNSVALTVFNWSDWPVCCPQTQKRTDRQTDIERKQYLHHSLCSLGGDNKLALKIPPYFERFATIPCKMLMSEWAPQINSAIWQRFDCFGHIFTVHALKRQLCELSVKNLIRKLDSATLSLSFSKTVPAHRTR